MQDVKPIRGKGNWNHFAADWKTTDSKICKLYIKNLDLDLEIKGNCLWSQTKTRTYPCAFSPEIQEGGEYMYEGFHKR